MDHFKVYVNISIARIHKQSHLYIQKKYNVRTTLFTLIHINLIALALA